MVETIDLIIYYNMSKLIVNVTANLIVDLEENSTIRVTITVKNNHRVIEVKNNNLVIIIVIITNINEIVVKE